MILKPDNDALPGHQGADQGQRSRKAIFTWAAGVLRERRKDDKLTVIVADPFFPFWENPEWKQADGGQGTEKEVAGRRYVFSDKEPADATLLDDADPETKGVSRKTFQEGLLIGL